MSLYTVRIVKLKFVSNQHFNLFYIFSDPCSGVKCDRIRPYSVCKVIDGDAQCICEECNNPVKDPVCASNTLTYSSECKMREVSCKIRETLTVVHKGKCRKFTFWFILLGIVQTSNFCRVILFRRRTNFRNVSNFKVQNIHIYKWEEWIS